MKWPITLTYPPRSLWPEQLGEPVSIQHIHSQPPILYRWRNRKTRHTLCPSCWITIITSVCKSINMSYSGGYYPNQQRPYYPNQYYPTTGWNTNGWNTNGWASNGNGYGNNNGYLGGTGNGGYGGFGGEWFSFSGANLYCALMVYFCRLQRKRWADHVLRLR